MNAPSTTDERAEADRSRIVVVVGPTGVGKTRLGVEVALAFNGEVVNADSRYLYRGFEIGVAKPDMEERRGVPHHLIDICEPNDEMSLATFQDLAYRAIDQVLARGRVPILVGGTPLYVNAVVEGWHIPRVPPNQEFRRRLEQEAAVHGRDGLTARLRAIDPITAERSGQNLRRVIRALEIFDATGRPMSEIESKGPAPYDALELRLAMSRPALYEVIDRRVNRQIAAGLVDEVRGLREGGVPPNAPSMSSLGYRQIAAYLDGDTTLEEAIEQTKHDTRRYLRHQETWLRRNPRLIPVDVEHPHWIARAQTLVAQFLESTGSSQGDGQSSVSPQP